MRKKRHEEIETPDENRKASCFALPLSATFGTPDLLRKSSFLMSDINP